VHDAKNGKPRGLPFFFGRALGGNRSERRSRRGAGNRRTSGRRRLDDGPWSFDSRAGSDAEHRHRLRQPRRLLLHRMRCGGGFLDQGRVLLRALVDAGEMTLLRPSITTSISPMAPNPRPRRLTMSRFCSFMYVVDPCKN